MKPSDLPTGERDLIVRGIKPTSNRILVMRELMKASHPVSLADLERTLGFSMDKASTSRSPYYAMHTLWKEQQYDN